VEKHHQKLHFGIGCSDIQLHFRIVFYHIFHNHHQVISITQEQSKHLSSLQVYLRINPQSKELFDHLYQSSKLKFIVLLSFGILPQLHLFQQSCFCVLFYQQVIS
jgi:hypothetical protein